VRRQGGTHNQEERRLVSPGPSTQILSGFDKVLSDEWVHLMDTETAVRPTHDDIHRNGGEADT
jgi:hypothetical protein